MRQRMGNARCCMSLVLLHTTGTIMLVLIQNMSFRSPKMLRRSQPGVQLCGIGAHDQNDNCVQREWRQ